MINKQAIKLICFIVPILMVGCAAPTKSFKEYAPSEVHTIRAALPNVALDQVVLGYTPKNAYEGEMVRKALEDSIIKANIFSDNASNFSIIKLKTLYATVDNSGAGRSANVVGIYVLSTKSGAVIHEITIHSQGESAWNDAFSGTTRSNNAFKMAVSSNIENFIAELSSYIDKNTDAIKSQFESELHQTKENKVTTDKTVPIDSKNQGPSVAAKPIDSGLATESPKIGLTRVKLVENGGTYTVPVRLNDQFNLNFTVDSGAADVTVPADVVLTLIRTGTISGSDFIGEQAYVLADGSKIKSKIFILRKLQVGDRTITNVQASLADVNGALLLGQSFLRRFKMWSVSNENHELQLQ